MIVYQYGNYRLELLDNDILITNNETGAVKRIPLSDKDKSLGGINIPLSNKCNMNCLYCSEADYMNGESEKTDTGFAFSVITAYMDYVNKKRKEIKKILLSFDFGGEPVLELDSMERIAGFFRETCIKNGLVPTVRITTNAVWDTGLLPRVMEAADDIIVSVDGYKEIYEKYRIHKNGMPVFERVIANAGELYRAKRLRQISCVVTEDSIEHYEKLTEFFIKEFPGITVKMSPVIYTGSAVMNGIKRIPVSEWKSFIKKVTEIADGRIGIIDCMPGKAPDIKYLYGCGYMDMTSWFCRFDNKVACCNGRDSDDYVIGIYKDKKLIMNEELMGRLYKDNNVLNIDKCTSCIAKFYCAGGCPKFRGDKINCDRRKEKYAEILMRFVESGPEF